MTPSALALPRRGLYALTPDDAGDIDALVARVLAVIAGGAALVQYRDKSAPGPERRIRAEALARACHAVGVPLIVNDSVTLAVETGAAGVHLGRDDGPVADARAALGKRAIIGVSCYDSLARARDAVLAGADYVAFGSVYPSSTKPAAVRCPLEVIAAARAELAVPIVAIGGITPENAQTVVAAGAGLLAVIGALFDRGDGAAAARAFAPAFT
ncbi:MAG: thiamine phosphate synthase [Gammaproteobacteria bacterium]